MQRLLPLGAGAGVLAALWLSPSPAYASTPAGYSSGDSASGGGDYGGGDLGGGDLGGGDFGALGDFS